MILKLLFQTLSSATLKANAVAMYEAKKTDPLVHFA